MKRIIVDYKKLTPEILKLLVEKYPEGYDDLNIISFKNAQGEIVECVEVRAEDTIYLVKVSTKLARSMENYEEDDFDDTFVDETEEAEADVVVMDNEESVASSDTTKKVEEDIRRLVFVVDGDKVNMVEVETGINDVSHIQILRGLDEGAEIVIGNYRLLSRQLNDGDKIRKN